jgi:hypothetical protein
VMTQASAHNVQPRAQLALANSPVLELRDLRVEQRNGSLLITGLVSSFYHKQLAQEVVRAVCKESNGAELELVNTVRVR